jgi:hypothetical protein
MSTPLEGPRRSNLIFVPRHEHGEPIRVDQLRRVRKPVTRSKSGVQGKVADVIHGRSRHAESQNELKAFQILVATAHANSWQEQPFTLEYHHEETKHRYTPDVLLDWGTCQEVVEIKDDQEAALPENRARFALISELLAQRGYHFRVWTRSEICAEPRLTNANLILRYRGVAISNPDRERVRRALCSMAEFNLQTLSETSRTSVPCVLRLVIEGKLHIDWWKPLGMKSKVGIAPIGRQIWPCLPATIVEAPREDARCH